MHRWRRCINVSNFIQSRKLAITCVLILNNQLSKHRKKSCNEFWYVDKIFYAHLYNHVAAKMKELTGFIVDRILIF